MRCAEARSSTCPRPDDLVLRCVIPRGPPRPCPVAERELLVGPGSEAPHQARGRSRDLDFAVTARIKEIAAADRLGDAAAQDEPSERSGVPHPVPVAPAAFP